MIHLAYREFEPSPLNIGFTVAPDRRDVVGNRRKYICIYGAGLYNQFAPLNDPSVEVWCLNLCPAFDTARRLRADRWFDIHQRVAQTEDDLKWIAKCPVPIYLPQDLMDASEHAVLYPIREIEARYRSYWACTFAYQIALAMYEGVATDIGLFGVELAFGTKRERTVERACVAYWLGRAEGAGIRIHTPPRSTLLGHPARYGLEYAKELDDVNRYIDERDKIDALRTMTRADVSTPLIES